MRDLVARSAVVCLAAACTKAPLESRAGAIDIHACDGIPVLATDYIGLLTVDATTAYWTDAGWYLGTPHASTIRAVAKTGGTVDTLVSVTDRSLSSYLALGDSLYYARAVDPYLGPYDLMRAPLADPSSAVQLADTSSIVGLAANSSDVFWQNAAVIGALAQAGGTPRVYLPIESNLDPSFRVDDRSLYVQTNRSGQRALFSIDLATHVARRLAGPATADAGFEADADALYWVTTDATGSQLVRVPKDGSAATTLGTSANHIGPVRSNGATVVWLDWQMSWDPNLGDNVFSGTLVGAAAIGGTPSTLSECVGDGVDNLALDDTSMYWTTECNDCADATEPLHAAALP